MALLWVMLLPVAWLVTAVCATQEDAKEMDETILEPLHILTDQNLLVLTPAGLAQMLNQTRFLMVLFRELSPCPQLWVSGGGRGGCVCAETCPVLLGVGRSLCCC